MRRAPSASARRFVIRFQLPDVSAARAEIGQQDDGLWTWHARTSLGGGSFSSDLADGSDIPGRSDVSKPGLFTTEARRHGENTGSYNGNRNSAPCVCVKQCVELATVLRTPNTFKTPCLSVSVVNRVVLLSAMEGA